MQCVTLSSSLLQQKHVQWRLLHTVTRQIAMWWDGVFLNSSKSTIGRAFDHSQPSLNLLSSSLRSIIISAVKPNATSGLNNFRGFNISDSHPLVSTFHPRGLLNTSLLFQFQPRTWTTFAYFAFFSNNLSRRTLNHLPYFVWQPIHEGLMVSSTNSLQLWASEKSQKERCYGK